MDCVLNEVSGKWSADDCGWPSFWFLRMLTGGHGTWKSSNEVYWNILIELVDFVSWDHRRLVSNSAEMNGGNDKFPGSDSGRVGEISGYPVVWWRHRKRSSRPRPLRPITTLNRLTLAERRNVVLQLSVCDWFRFFFKKKKMKSWIPGGWWSPQVGDRDLILHFCSRVAYGDFCILGKSAPGGCWGLSGAQMGEYLVVLCHIFPPRRDDDWFPFYLSAFSPLR